MQLVDLAQACPDVVVDLRYARPENIAGHTLYDSDFVAQLDAPAAQALQHAAEDLKSQGYRLLVWDAYRPQNVQQELLQLDSTYVDTYVLTESNHCKGLAVDATLTTAAGQLLDMGTDHDEFTELAHVGAAGLSDAQIANRALFTNAMRAAGFTVWSYEWWHFDYTGAN